MPGCTCTMSGGRCPETLFCNRQAADQPPQSSRSIWLVSQATRLKPPPFRTPFTYTTLCHATAPLALPSLPRGCQTAPATSPSARLSPTLPSPRLSTYLSSLSPLQAPSRPCPAGLPWAKAPSATGAAGVKPHWSLQTWEECLSFTARSRVWGSAPRFAGHCWCQSCLTVLWTATVFVAPEFSMASSNMRPPPPLMYCVSDLPWGHR